MGPLRLCLMVVGLTALAYLATQLMYIEPGVEPAVQIDVYADRFEFQRERYPSITALAIGLEAAREEPTSIELRDCSAQSQLTAVLDLIRERGQYNIAIEMPEGC